MTDTKEHAIERCNDPNPLEQVRGLLSLRDLGASASDCLPLSIRLVSSPDARVRAAAAEACGALGSAAMDAKTMVTSALDALLDDSESLVRGEAVYALAKLADERSLPRFRTLLETDECPLVRVAAAEVLGNVKDASSLRSLLRAINDDEDDTVRAFAASSLGVLAGKEALPALARALACETSESVRASLQAASYRLGDSASMGELKQQLATAGQRLGTVILNELIDLTVRKTPAALIQDAPDLVASLKALVARDSFHTALVEKLVGRLTMMTAGAKP